MIVRTLEQIAALAGGKLHGYSESAQQTIIRGVSTDSRTIEPDRLFVPLDVGVRFDGHDFVREALAKGAAAALWQRDRIMPDDAHDWPLIVVDDTLAALQQLAAGYLKELPVKVVGITGSNGKTTTRDMVAAVLSTKYRVHKTAGNLNTDIGLPLTVLQIDENVDMLVLEMGMRGLGEIELLSSIARPDAAVITNIGEAHLELLRSRENIARAKLEIVIGLKDGGLLVYPGEEPLLTMLLPETPKPADMITVRFGETEEMDLFPTEIKPQGHGIRFRLHGIDQTFHLPVPGRHNVLNAAAAVAVGRHFAVPPELMAEGLAGFELTGQRVEFVEAAGGFTLLNDAYNASPASMRAAIRLVEELEGFPRRLAVLGDMLELGEDELAYHAAIGGELKPDVFRYVFTFGSRAEHIARTAAAGGLFPADAVRSYSDKTKLIEELQSVIQPGDLVLVKGSRGMKLEEVVVAMLGFSPD